MAMGNFVVAYQMVTLLKEMTGAHIFVIRVFTVFVTVFIGISVHISITHALFTAIT